MSHTYCHTCETEIHAIVAQIQDKLHKIAQHAHDINLRLRHSVANVVGCALMRIFSRVAITSDTIAARLLDMQKMHRQQYVYGNYSLELVLDGPHMKWSSRFYFDLNSFFALLCLNVIILYSVALRFHQFRRFVIFTAQFFLNYPKIYFSIFEFWSLHEFCS